MNEWKQIDQLWEVEKLRFCDSVTCAVLPNRLILWQAGKNAPPRRSRLSENHPPTPSRPERMRCSGASGDDSLGAGRHLSLVTR